MEKFLVFIIIILIALLFSAIGSIYGEKDSFFDRLTNKVGMATVLVLFGLYLTYNMVFIGLTQNTRNSTVRLNDISYVSIIKEITRNCSDCPKFCNSLYFPWQISEINNGSTITYDNTSVDKWNVVMSLSIQIFQSWDDVLTLNILDETEFSVWLAHFLQWANSPILKKAWEVTKANYSKYTIEFGNYLFDFIELNKINNLDELKTAALLLATSPVMKEIIRKRNLIKQTNFESFKK